MWVNAGDPLENIVMQEIQNSIKASSVHLFLIYYAYIGGSVSHPPGISVETFTRDSPYENMTIDDVID